MLSFSISLGFFSSFAFISFWSSNRKTSIPKKSRVNNRSLFFCSSNCCTAQIISIKHWEISLENVIFSPIFATIIKIGLLIALSTSTLADLGPVSFDFFHMSLQLNFDSFIIFLFFLCSPCHLNSLERSNSAHSSSRSPSFLSRKFSRILVAEEPMARKIQHWGHVGKQKNKDNNEEEKMDTKAISSNNN